MKNSVLFMITVFLLAFGLSACGEREQVAEVRSGDKYQGKRDGRPWDSAPLAQEFRGGKWTAGNRQSWEEQIKARQLSQHEDKRIY